jgi:HTH-type transcriptional regulator/antitoxin HigA
MAKNSPRKTAEPSRASLLEIPEIDLSKVKLLCRGSGLDMLAQAIKAYEKEHFPIDPPSPSEVVRFRLEHEGKVATLR